MVNLTVWQVVTGFVIAMGIPSALTGFLVWKFERRIAKRDKEREQREAELRNAAAERERAREDLELILIEGINAAIALSEATARAVERIPDAHCNGDMHAALDYAAQVKHRQKDFLAKQGVKALVS